jgi:hypothetical protein
VSLEVARRVRRRFSVSKLPPISRPLETGFISLKSHDAGRGFVREPALRAGHAKPSQVEKGVRSRPAGTTHSF